MWNVPNFAESRDNKDPKTWRESEEKEICKIEVWKEDNLITVHVMTIKRDENVGIMRIQEECKHVYFLSHNYFEKPQCINVSQNMLSDSHAEWQLMHQK